MAARQYSQFKTRKQLAPGKKGKSKHSEQSGVDGLGGMRYHCPNWGDQLGNPSDPGWGSDTAKVQVYPKAKGLKG